MALFKVTNKRLVLNSRGQRIEAGISAEVMYNGSVLPLSDLKVRAELTRQFKVKYNIDYPTGYINTSCLEITKL